MKYWLIMLMHTYTPPAAVPQNAGGVALLHVGTFASIDECKKAATEADKNGRIIVTPKTGTAVEYNCVWSGDLN